MKSTKVAVLTSEVSWYFPHAKKIVEKISNLGFNVEFFVDHRDIVGKFDIVFILSYFCIIPIEVLNKSKHNLVVHESDLPKGRGWAPYFWQILEGKKQVPIVLFEASKEVDEGVIYLKNQIQLSGDELYEELRTLQAQKTESLCLQFLNGYPSNIGFTQMGEPTYYPKRTPRDSELDINKTIEEQFQKLRVANNQDFPAFFIKDGVKYKLQIEKMK